MSTPVEFHAQLASIMEVLANAAVAEICELVDNGYAVLHLEISRSQKENESLRRKLRLMELKVARVSALRAAGIGSSIFASSRVRASHLGSELKRTHGSEVPLPRVSTQVALRCGDAEPPGDTGQEIGHRKAASVNPVKIQTPVIKVENEDDSWPPSSAQQDKGFNQIVEDGPEEPDTEAPPPVAKQEVTKPDVSRSHSWESRVDSASTSPTPLSHSKRSEANSSLPESDNYDCMMYEPQVQRGSLSSQNPPAEEPSCSYSVSARVNVSAPSDPAVRFPFTIGDVAHSAPEPQQPTVFPDSVQRAPLPADEPLIPSRKDVLPAVANAFVTQEDWLAQEGFPSTAGYSRDDPGGKTFICSFCGKTLACLKNLKTHIRVHTGEKPFSCALCGKRFSDSSNLKRHQSVHTGEKRYGCVHCGKRFAQSGSLKVHMSVHTGCKQFTCLYCSKTFISANHLRRHIVLHGGDKRLPSVFQ